jgi:hypothetical protein
MFKQYKELWQNIRLGLGYFSRWYPCNSCNNELLRNRDDVKGLTCKTYGADEKFIEILARKPEVERLLSEEPDLDI